MFTLDTSISRLIPLERANIPCLFEKYFVMILVKKKSTPIILILSVENNKAYHILYF